MLLAALLSAVAAQSVASLYRFNDGSIGPSCQCELADSHMNPDSWGSSDLVDGYSSSGSATSPSSGAANVNAASPAANVDQVPSGAIVLQTISAGSSNVIIYAQISVSLSVEISVETLSIGDSPSTITRTVTVPVTKMITGSATVSALPTSMASLSQSSGIFQNTTSSIRNGGAGISAVETVSTVVVSSSSSASDTSSISLSSPSITNTTPPVTSTLDLASTSSDTVVVLSTGYTSSSSATPTTTSTSSTSTTSTPAGLLAPLVAQNAAEVSALCTALLVTTSTITSAETATVESIYSITETSMITETNTDLTTETSYDSTTATDTTTASSTYTSITTEISTITTTQTFTPTAAAVKRQDAIGTSFSSIASSSPDAVSTECVSLVGSQMAATVSSTSSGMTTSITTATDVTTSTTTETTAQTSTVLITSTISETSTSVESTDTTVTSTYSSTKTTLLPSACGTLNAQGLAWAAYRSPVPPDDHIYDFDPTPYKNAAPIETGVTASPGGSFTNDPVTVYDAQIAFPLDHFVLNHRGFFFTPIDDDYRFAFGPGIDDVAELWLGDEAVLGWNLENAALRTPGGYQVTRTLVAGTYYPIRIVYLNTVQVGKFDFSVQAVSDPDDVYIVNPNEPSPYLLQGNCDAVNSFPQFGCELGGLCPDMSCPSTTGLQWAYQNNPYPDYSNSYAQFDPEYFKTEEPEFIGVTKIVYDNNSNPIYDSQGTELGSENYALNHRGYIFARITGTYTFQFLEGFDDISILWIGPNAYNGWSRSNADIVEAIGDGQLEPIRLRLTAGSYTPIRILYGNAPGEAHLMMEITDPQGYTIVDRGGYTPTNYLVQYGCNEAADLAPQYPAFGNEADRPVTVDGPVTVVEPVTVDAT